MLESLANTSVLGWFTQCTFGEKVALISISKFKVAKILPQIHFYFIYFSLDKNGMFFIIKHYQSFTKLPFLWWNFSLITTNARSAIIQQIAYDGSVLMVQSDLIHNTNDTTKWGMRFHPRKWDATKTRLWSTLCIVKDQREQKVLDDVFVMLEVVGIESQFPIKRKMGQVRWDNCW